MWCWPYIVATLCFSACVSVSCEEEADADADAE